MSSLSPSLERNVDLVATTMTSLALRQLLVLSAFKSHSEKLITDRNLMLLTEQTSRLVVFV
jgi:hypothetical protein